MDILEQLRNGQLKLRDLEKVAGSSEEAARLRRAYLETETGTSLAHTGQFSFDIDTANTYNVENLIGVTQIPLGITEPLRINGEYAQGDFRVPLATTEKSLIAGISRGCKAITQAGGAETWVRQDKMTRAPLFRVDNQAQAKSLLLWLEGNFDKLQAEVKAISSHSGLIEQESWIAGRNVFVKFHFSTGDAMGMNMVTRACDRIGHLIENSVPGVHYQSVSGNMCIDKKPAAMNLISGRGKTVLAEVVLPASVIEKTLKTSASAMAEVAYRKNLIGSAYAGSLGFNAHFANVVAALYIATGQDPAHVVEGSIGFSLMEPVGDNALHASVTMPAIEVATVGGGTRLQTQSEALALLGCLGSRDSLGSSARKLAEIVSAAVLAGEISLIAAEAAHHLAEAHKITAR